MASEWLQRLRLRRARPRAVEVGDGEDEEGVGDARAHARVHVQAWVVARVRLEVAEAGKVIQMTPCIFLSIITKGIYRGMCE